MQKMMRLSAFCLFVVVLLFFFFCPVPPCGNYVAPGFEHLHDDSVAQMIVTRNHNVFVFVYDDYKSYPQLSEFWAGTWNRDPETRGYSFGLKELDHYHGGEAVLVTETKALSFCWGILYDMDEYCPLEPESGHNIPFQKRTARPSYCVFPRACLNPLYLFFQSLSFFDVLLAFFAGLSVCFIGWFFRRLKQKRNGVSSTDPIKRNEESSSK